MKSFYEMMELMELNPPQPIQQPIQQANQPQGVQQTQAKVVNPQANAGAKSNNNLSEEGVAEIKKLLGDAYPTFVKKLDTQINDQRFLQAIRAITQSGSKVQMQEISPTCDSLRPTQNEVVLDKSLSYPMKGADDAANSLNPSGPIKLGEKGKELPIITSNGGQFVIDGHHRWSQVYCLNPKAQMAAVDIGNLGTPEQALKAVQIGIAASIGDVPKAQGGGINLFQIDENTLTNYVASAITQEVVDTFKKLRPDIFPKQEAWTPPDPNQKTLDFNHDPDIAAIAKYIWGNVQQLKQKSNPVPPAPNREVMPQTDNAPQFPQFTVPVQQIANIADKMMQANKQLAAHTKHEGPSLNEWLILSGVKKD